MWDQRYAAEEYAYGTQPNEYLAAMVGRLASGRVLCLGEGEGRNAVWLAQRGFEVTALDASAVGLEKAQRLARERGVRIATVHADLAEYTIQPESWSSIVSIFCHLPPPLRREVHRQAVTGLHAGGTLLLEAYTTEQLGYKTGGPPVAEMMMDLDTLRRELHGMELLLAREKLREIHEGEFHNGLGAVVQILARKPVV